MFFTLRLHQSFQGFCQVLLFLICETDVFNLFQIVLDSFYVLWVVFVGAKLFRLLSVFRIFHVFGIVSSCCCFSGCLMLLSVV